MKKTGSYQCLIFIHFLLKQRQELNLKENKNEQLKPIDEKRSGETQQKIEGFALLSVEFPKLGT